MNAGERGLLADDLAAAGLPALGKVVAADLETLRATVETRLPWDLRGDCDALRDADVADLLEQHDYYLRPPTRWGDLYRLLCHIADAQAELAELVTRHDFAADPREPTAGFAPPTP